MAPVEPIICNAAVCWGPGQDLKIERVEVAPPKAGEIRIKMVAASLCHTDDGTRNGIDIGYPVPHYPVILGHEGAGIVESVGPGVKSLKPGDKVLPFAIANCQKCPSCLSPKTNNCEALGPDFEISNEGFMSDRTSRFRHVDSGQMIYHYMGDSTFSEYTVCNEICVAKINSAAPLDKVCVLACGVTTGYGAPLNNAKVTPGSTCGIWGLGAVGLGLIAGCKRAGASRICAIDINSSRFGLAKDFGATDFLNPKDYPGKQFSELLIEVLKLNGGGFDYTFEACGVTTVMQQAYQSSHPRWGDCTLIGGGDVSGILKVHPIELILGRKVRGSLMGGWKMREALPKLVDEYVQGTIELPIDKMITQQLEFGDINKAIEALEKGIGLKSVMLFN